MWWSWRLFWFQFTSNFFTPFPFRDLACFSLLLCYHRVATLRIWERNRKDWCSAWKAARYCLRTRRRPCIPFRELNFASWLHSVIPYLDSLLFAFCLVYSALILTAQIPTKQILGANYSVSSSIGPLCALNSKTEVSLCWAFLPMHPRLKVSNHPYINPSVRPLIWSLTTFLPLKWRCRGLKDGLLDDVELAGWVHPKTYSRQ